MKSDANHATINNNIQVAVVIVCGGILQTQHIEHVEPLANVKTPVNDNSVNIELPKSVFRLERLPAMIHSRADAAT